MVQGLKKNQLKKHFSMYIDKIDYIKLKEMAKIEGEKITTMARVLFLNGLRQLENEYDKNLTSIQTKDGSFIVRPIGTLKTGAKIYEEVK